MISPAHSKNYTAKTNKRKTTSRKRTNDWAARMRGTAPEELPLL